MNPFEWMMQLALTGGGRVVLALIWLIGVALLILLEILEVKYG